MTLVKFFSETKRQEKLKKCKIRKKIEYKFLFAIQNEETKKSNKFFLRKKSKYLKFTIYDVNEVWVISLFS